jgi:hypothetical protein
LARVQDVGSLDAPRIPNDLWDVTDGVDKYGKVIRKRIDRGPIFSRTGSVRRDWDPLFWVPVYVARLEDYKLDNEAVAHGAILPMVRKWQTSLRRRVQESADAAGRELKRKTRDLSEEAHRKLMFEANKPDATTPIVAWKHAREEVEAFYRRNEGLENYYDPVKDMRRY